MQGWLGKAATAVVVAFGLGSQWVAAAPAQVIVIRHGEKIEETGQLSPRGLQRARAMVNYFRSRPEVTAFGTPVAIYAPHPKHPGSSHRPIDTVTPLAASLGMNLNTSFTKDEAQDLVAEVMSRSEYDGKMVLICWNHTNIPDIGVALGNRAAPTWPDEVFDRAWIFDFDGERLAGFRDIPQNLLPGDRKTVAPAPTP